MAQAKIACQKLCFSNEEKMLYEELRGKIFKELVKIEELEDGYTFVLEGKEHLLSDLVIWIPLEKKCCPFLKFTINIYHDDYLYLKLTGPDETKQFLLLELKLDQK
ncbi:MULTISPECIES: hypothetical protein [Gracilibacillus]|uniref:Uncharacterized protein n=1 Tax=Gracilibacillus dipsosauri TaxID=178340 RepID=A0A317L3F4_9BACI|nr:hypothetical protein [Gracilibacillus dipsosauri]PWU70422.1 hypothetical protein DLJ74_00895 [Gracilibacillus dipsosauri]